MSRPAMAAATAMLLATVGIASAAAPIVVKQVHRSFSIASLRIMRGETVHFTNTDEFIHHLFVDSPAMKFNSGEQPPGRDVDVTFGTAGTFEVRCEIHPRMLLTVAVE